MLKRFAIPVALVACLLAPTSNAEARRAFPAFIMVQGPGIREPIIIHHAGVSDIRNSPLVILWDATSRGQTFHALTSIKSEYDVAIFDGMWHSAIRNDGTLKQPVKFSDALSRTKLVVSAEGVLWLDATTAGRGAAWVGYRGPPSYRRLSPAAVTVLRKAGVPSIR